MNKSQLITNLADKMAISRETASAILEAFCNVISDGLLSGQEVNIHGFGKFYLAQRKTRKGYNPKTKEPMQIQGYTTPCFKPGRPLKLNIKAKYDF